MSTYVQVILELEREASRDGLSLSGWIRQAALERATERQRRDRIDSVAGLRELFRACDAREHGDEPDWHEHVAIITKSIASGAGDS